jgi:hypothetical protein
MNSVFVRFLPNPKPFTSIFKACFLFFIMKALTVVYRILGKGKCIVASYFPSRIEDVKIKQNFYAFGENGEIPIEEIAEYVNLGKPLGPTFIETRDGSRGWSKVEIMENNDLIAQLSSSGLGQEEIEKLKAKL